MKEKENNEDEKEIKKIKKTYAYTSLKIYTIKIHYYISNNKKICIYIPKSL